MAEWTFPIYTDLSTAVNRFFEILDAEEFSDNAMKYYHPVKLQVEEKVFISSIRVYKTAELSSLLPQMKQLAVNTKSNT